MTEFSEDFIRQAIAECANEPIHISGAIQPHGFLVVLSADGAFTLNIIGCSQNLVELLGVAHEMLIGKSLNYLFHEEQVRHLVDKIQHASLSSETAYYKTINPLPLTLFCKDKKLEVEAVIHLSNLGFVLEIEPTQTVDFSQTNTDVFYQISKKSIIRIQHALTLEQLYDAVVEEVRQITGYDRVMLYRFDKNYNGQVVAEAKQSDMEPFLGLHYPASDIPAQARELYKRSWLRTIVDVNYVPSPILLKKEIDEPLDLSHSILRSVSPVHIQYLQNMGIGSSLSISIIIDEELWGLIACHHRSAYQLDYTTRMTAEFFGQMASLHLSNLQRNAIQLDQIEKQTIHEGIIETLQEELDIYSGLWRKKQSLLQLANADSMALVINGQVQHTKGAPDESIIRTLATWLNQHHPRAVFYTDCISNHLEGMQSYANQVAGLSSICISEQDKSRLIWFRVEQEQHVSWAGKPQKNIIKTADKYVLTPRNSFDKWVEITRFTSFEWTPNQLQIIEQLQAKVLFLITLRIEEMRKEERRKQLEELVKIRTEELLKINEQLVEEARERMRIAQQLAEGVQKLEISNKELEHFAYVASHDLQEPLRVVASFSQLLERQYKQYLDEKALMYIKFIVEGAERMKMLIQDLLQYSRLNRTELVSTTINLNDIVDNAIENLRMQVEETKAHINVAHLPTINGSQLKLVQLFQNLIGNAIKYRSEHIEPQIVITHQDKGDHWQFTISDNGIGIDAKYAERIFIIFQRLHTKERYSGTGIGLALCQKIVEQHGGKIWLDTDVKEGTTFHFTITKNL